VARRKRKAKGEQPRQAATRIKKGAFLDAYRRVATIAAACRVAGVDRMTHYRWIEADPAYVLAFKDAQEDATDLLEQEARRRAIVGVEEPVVYQGAFCYETDSVTGERRQVVVRRYSDMLLQAQLNAHRPEKYRYRVEHAGPGGGPIPHRHAGTIVVVDGPKDKYMAGLQKAREAALAAAGGDGHGGDGAGKAPGDGGGG
jgi:hypothetical protein